ncbi:MAG: Cof-type HAD-IIB family hydrolase, partial [Malacoplasma sp.]|nr:Cof-type HAD-IIB family hydrolase [Malacoplasma sp.]
MILEWAFIDLDGTLLNQRKRIPKKNLEILKKYVENNGNIVITTGRWPISALKINKKIENFSNNRNKYLIAMNGANIYDLKENKIIYEKEIDLKIFNEILEETKNYSISAWIYSQKGIQNKTVYSVKIPVKKIISKFNYGKIVELKKRKIKEDKIFKALFLTWTKKEMNKFVNFLKEKYDKELSIVKITGKAIEVTAKNTSKGEAIKIIQKIEKFKLENTVALGDSQNDLSMFQVCNYKVCFNNEEKNLVDLANISFKNQSKFDEAFEKYIIPYQNFQKNNSTIKLNLNNWYEKFDDQIIKSYKNFWKYLINQRNLIIETSFPIWLSKNIFKSFLINKNISWTNQNFS